MRVLIVVMVQQGLGHMTRGLGIALELQRRGHEVLVGCAELGMPIAVEAGVPAVSLDEGKPFPAVPTTDLAAYNAKLWAERASPEYLGRSLEQEAALVREFRPDVVINVHRPVANISAALAGVPSIRVLNAGLLAYPIPQMLQAQLPALAALGVPAWATKKAFGDVLMIADVARFEPLHQIPMPSMQLVLDSVREIRHVGLILRNHPADLPSRADIKRRLDHGDLPLVYVSFGGSTLGFEYLQRTLRALAAIRAAFVVVSGPTIDPRLIESDVDRIRKASRGATVTVYGYTARTVELMKAADVAVVAGGHNTVIEGMLCGTPLVVIPLHPEQRINAARVVELGTGCLVDPDQLEEDVFAMTQRSLTDTSMARGAEAAAHKLGRCRGEVELADYVERHL